MNRRVIPRWAGPAARAPRAPSGWALGLILLMGAEVLATVGEDAGASVEEWRAVGVPRVEMSELAEGELRVRTIALDTVQVSWELSAGMLGWVLQRSIGRELFEDVMPVEAPLGRRREVVEPGRRVRFRLALFAEDGEARFGKPVSVVSRLPPLEVSVRVDSSQALVRWDPAGVEGDSVALWRAAADGADLWAEAHLVGRASVASGALRDRVEAGEVRAGSSGRAELVYWVTRWPRPRFAAEPRLRFARVPLQAPRDLELSEAVWTRSLKGGGPDDSRLRPTPPWPPPRVRARGTRRVEVWSDEVGPARIERRRLGRDAVFEPVGSLRAGERWVDTGLGIDPGMRVQYRLVDPRNPEPPGVASDAVIVDWLPPEFLAVERLSDSAARVRIVEPDSTVDGHRFYRRILSTAGGESMSVDWSALDALVIPELAVGSARDDESWQLRAELPAAVGEWTDTDLRMGDRVIYRVESRRGAAAMAEAVSPWPLEMAVGPPDDLAVEVGVGRRVNLSWTDSLDYELGYCVHRDDGDGFRRLAELPPGTESFGDSTLSGPGPWRYAVSTRLSTGETARSSALPLVLNVGAPARLRGGVDSLEKVRLKWEPRGATISGFVVERRREPDLVHEAIATLLPTITEFVDRGVGPGDALSYRVRALGITQVSAPSRSWSVRLPDPMAELVPLLALPGAEISGRRVSRREYAIYCSSTAREVPADWEAAPELMGGDATGLHWLEAVGFLNWLSSLACLEPAYEPGGAVIAGTGGFVLPSLEMFRAWLGDDDGRSLRVLRGPGGRGEVPGRLTDEGIFGVYSPGALPVRSLAPDEGQTQIPGATGGREWLTDEFFPEAPVPATGKRWRLVLGGAVFDDPAIRRATMVFPFEQRVRRKEVAFRVARRFPGSVSESDKSPAPSVPDVISYGSVGP